MRGDAVLRVNAPAVVGELIDGEAVIMNLQSGNYFSTRGSGALVWGWLSNGASGALLHAQFARVFSLPQERAQAELGAFLQTLLDNDLIIAAPAAALAPQTQIPELGAQDVAGYSPPVLDIYDDMQDLLLLDPIHDVDDEGWPSANGTAAGGGRA